MTALIATLSYGIIVLVGGLGGYIKAKSKASLISGLIFGLLLLMCAYLQSLEFSWALWLAVAITIALIIVFSLRLQKSGKFMPAGIMIILGVIALILMIF